MAVYQATGMPAVSLPNGASSLPPEVLPLLERFEKIYLWMDHDGAGQAGVDKFVQKLVSGWAISFSSALRIVAGSLRLHHYGMSFWSDCTGL